MEGGGRERRGGWEEERVRGGEGEEGEEGEERKKVNVGHTYTYVRILTGLLGCGRQEVEREGTGLYRTHSHSMQACVSVFRAHNQCLPIAATPLSTNSECNNQLYANQPYADERMPQSPPRSSPPGGTSAGQPVSTL